MVILKLHKSYCLSEYKQNLQKKKNSSFTLQTMKMKHFELNYLGSDKEVHKEALPQHLLSL